MHNKQSGVRTVRMAKGWFLIRIKKRADFILHDKILSGRLYGNLFQRNRRDVPGL